MIAGCSISDSTPPSDSAQAKSCSALQEARAPRRARRALAVNDEADHAAEAATSAARPARAAGASAGPGRSPSRPRGAPRASARRARVLLRGAPCARPASWCRAGPGSSRRRGGCRPWRSAGRRAARAASGSRPIDRAADDVGVAVQVLGRRVHDQVGAELERALEVRRHEGVVDGEAGRRALRRSRRRRAMSAELEQRVGRRLDPAPASCAGVIAAANARGVARRRRR